MTAAVILHLYCDRLRDPKARGKRRQNFFLFISILCIRIEHDRKTIIFKCNRYLLLFKLLFYTQIQDLIKLRFI